MDRRMGVGILLGSFWAARAYHSTSASVWLLARVRFKLFMGVLLGYCPHSVTAG